MTRLEVVLVLSLVLLNVAIFLPYVQHMREASRQTQCKNNLKQIGLAAHYFHDVHGRMPAGFEVHPDGHYSGWGWNLKLLPYLDAADVFQRIVPYLKDGIYGLPAGRELHRQPRSLTCPSDTESDTVPHAMVVSAPVVDGIVSEATKDWPNRLPRSNYFGNAGYLQKEAGGIQYNAAGIPTSIVPLVNRGSLGNAGTVRSSEYRYCDQKLFGGYFGQNSHVEIRDFVDGTSNTFMFGERYSPVDLTADAVGHGTWIGVPDCTPAQGLAMALADTSVRINIGRPLREQTTGFGSIHPGGAFFALGDGSVKFVSQQLALVAFRNLSVIDDGIR